MLMDDRNLFADAGHPVDGPVVGPGGATLTATANTTTQFGHILPLSVARDLGVGRPLYLVVIAASALSAVGATPTTVAFTLMTGSTTTGSPPSINTPTYLRTSQFITVPALASPIAAGTPLWIEPLPIKTHGLDYSTLLSLANTNGAAAALAAGCKVDAFLTSDISRWKPYADAVN